MNETRESVFMKAEKWNLAEYEELTGTDEISATARVDKNSLWFSGHFPENPILPGIAQLAMILEVLQKAVHNRMSVSGIRRVRFKRIVRPGDELRLFIKPGSGNEYSFRIMLENQIACSGAVTAVTVD